MHRVRHKGIFSTGEAPARIVRGARAIEILHRRLIGPTLRPIGPHRDEGALRDAAVLRFSNPRTSASERM